MKQRQGHLQQKQYTWRKESIKIFQLSSYRSSKRPNVLYNVDPDQTALKEKF